MTSLLLFYYYILEFVCLRDEQAVYKQGSVHVKARTRNVCHNAYITLGVLLISGIGKRYGKNCSDWQVLPNLGRSLIFFFKQY